MTRTSAIVWIGELSSRNPDLEVFPPCPDSALAAAEETVGLLPADLKELYAVTNGLRCRAFTVFPILEPGREKRTWDSIQRANDPAKTDALGGDLELLRKFLVFADIGNGFAAIDRSDGTIWYEEAGEGSLHRTTLDLRHFVERMVANVE